MSGCKHSPKEYQYHLFELSPDGNTYYNVYKSCLYCNRINETHFECGNGCEGEFHPDENVTEEYLADYMAMGYN